MDGPRHHLKVCKDHPLGALALYVEAKEREASGKDATVRALQRALAEKDVKLERTKVAAVVALQWLSFSMDTLQRDHSLLTKQANQDRAEYETAVEVAVAEQDKQKARSLELLIEKEHLQAVHNTCLRELKAERETSARLRAKISELSGRNRKGDRLSALDAWVASEGSGIERAMAKLAKIKSSEEQSKEVAAKEDPPRNGKEDSIAKNAATKSTTSAATKRQRPLLTTKRSHVNKQNGKENPAPKKQRVGKQSPASKKTKLVTGEVAEVTDENVGP